MEKLKNVSDKVSGMAEKVNRNLRRNAAGQTDKAPKMHRGMKINRNTKKTVRETCVSWGFLMPSLMGVMTFFVLPFCVVVFYALVNNPIQKEFVGLFNFERVFTNNAFRQAAYNTFKFSIIAVPLSVILSLFLAVVME